MNNEQSFQKDDIITLINIDTETFVFEYNTSEGNPSYDIPSGEARRYPGWLADHALKNLIDKILTKRDIRITNAAERHKLAEEIVVSVESLRRERKETEAEILAKKISTLNSPSDLELVVQNLDKRDNKNREVKKKETETTKGVETTTKTLPTKEELLKYANDKLRLNMDPKTEKKLKGMKVDDLIKELDYPVKE